MGTLSMGCSVEHTTCTKCGNVAVDETELCECVKYNKGNTFIDAHGQKHRVAELCGHDTEDPTGGVAFIEASWVASPAFTGAVMRNIIEPEALTAKTAQQIQTILASPPPEWVDGQRRAARQESQVVGSVANRRAQFDFQDAPAEGDAAPAEGAPKKDPTPFDDLEDRVVKNMLDRVERKIQDQLSGAKPAPGAEDSTAKMNDSLNRNAHTRAVVASIKAASSDADLMNKIALADDKFGMKAPISVYRTVLKVGSISKYGSTESFLFACRDVMGRALGLPEGRALIRLGRILQQHAEGNSRIPTPDKRK
jgi:hypothetical protein